MHRPKQLSMSLTLLAAKMQVEDIDARWLDVSDVALGTGFTMKVVISAGLSDLLEENEIETDGDYDQRLWDALWMAHFKLSLDHSQSATFNFTFQRKHWRTDEMMDVSLRLRVEVRGQAAFIGLLEDF